jgi:hypothetical protein
MTKVRVDPLAVAALVTAFATNGIAMTLVMGNLAMAFATGDVVGADRNACDLRLNIELSTDVAQARGSPVVGALLKDPLFPLASVCHADPGLLVEVRGPVYRAGTR